jgi:hypothetical protein
MLGDNKWNIWNLFFIVFFWRKCATKLFSIVLFWHKRATYQSRDNNPATLIYSPANSYNSEITYNKACHAPPAMPISVNCVKTKSQVACDKTITIRLWQNNYKVYDLARLCQNRKSLLTKQLLELSCDKTNHGHDGTLSTISHACVKTGKYTIDTNCTVHFNVCYQAIVLFWHQCAT